MRYVLIIFLILCVIGLYSQNIGDEYSSVEQILNYYTNSENKILERKYFNGEVVELVVKNEFEYLLPNIQKEVGTNQFEIFYNRRFLFHNNKLYKVIKEYYNLSAIEVHRYNLFYHDYVKSDEFFVIKDSRSMLKIILTENGLAGEEITDLRLNEISKKAYYEVNLILNPITINIELTDFEDYKELNERSLSKFIDDYLLYIKIQYEKKHAFEIKDFLSVVLNKEFKNDFEARNYYEDIQGRLSVMLKTDLMYSRFIYYIYLKWYTLSEYYSYFIRNVSKGDNTWLIEYFKKKHEDFRNREIEPTDLFFGYDLQYLKVVDYNDMYQDIVDLIYFNSVEANQDLGNLYLNDTTIQLSIRYVRQNGIGDIEILKKETSDNNYISLLSSSIATILEDDLDKLFKRYFDKPDLIEFNIEFVAVGSNTERLYNYNPKGNKELERLYKVQSSDIEYSIVNTNSSNIKPSNSDWLYKVGYVDLYINKNNPVRYMGYEIDQRIIIPKKTKNQLLINIE